MCRRARMFRPGRRSTSRAPKHRMADPVQRHVAQRERIFGGDGSSASNDTTSASKPVVGAECGSGKHGNSNASLPALTVSLASRGSQDASSTGSPGLAQGPSLEIVPAASLQPSDLPRIPAGECRAIQLPLSSRRFGFRRELARHGSRALYSCHAAHILALFRNQLPLRDVRQYSSDRDDELGRGRAEAAVAEGALPRRAELHAPEVADARGAPAHRLRRGALPEHRRVLGGRHGDVHDPGRHVHARLRLLRSQVRPPRRAPTALEPMRVANAVREMGLTHAVVTSVNRDDQPDGGASIFAADDPLDPPPLARRRASRC